MKIVWLLSIPTVASVVASRSKPTAATPRVPRGCVKTLRLTHVYGSHTIAVGSRPSCPDAHRSFALETVRHLTSSVCPRKKRCLFVRLSYTTPRPAAQYTISVSSDQSSL
jgi:hypothetical protein